MLTKQLMNDKYIDIFLNDASVHTISKYSNEIQKSETDPSNCKHAYILNKSPNLLRTRHIF